MGNKSSTTNYNTVINSGNGSSSGDNSQTSGKNNQTDSTSTSVQVPAELLAIPKATTSKPAPLPAANTLKAVNDVGGSAFLSASAKTQTAIAPFTSTIDKIGSTTPAATSGKKSVGSVDDGGKSSASQSELMGALAASHDQAQKNWAAGNGKGKSGKTATTDNAKGSTKTGKTAAANGTKGSTKTGKSSTTKSTEDDDEEDDDDEGGWYSAFVSDRRYLSFQCEL